MGSQNRDWMRNRRRPFEGGAGAHAVVWWTIGLNVLFWFVFAGAFRSGSRLGEWAYTFLPLDVPAVLRGAVWQPFTAIWMHDPSRITHLLMNMLMLYFFGREVEERLGRKGMVVLYLGAGLSSTLMLVGIGLLWDRPILALGASGAVYGVLVWMATKEPHRQVLFFGVVPMPMWAMVGGFMVLGDVMSLSNPTVVPVASIGHLSGALFGFVFARRGGIGLPTIRAVPRRRPQEVQREREPSPLRPRQDQATKERVDALLAKIHAEGITALSDEEKRFLEQASRGYR